MQTYEYSDIKLICVPKSY